LLLIVRLCIRDLFAAVRPIEAAMSDVIEQEWAF
jgi:hypothetical protein